VDVNSPFFTGVVRSDPSTTFESRVRSCLEGELIGVRELAAPADTGEADGGLTSEAGGDGFTSPSAAVALVGVDTTCMTVQLAAECSFFGLLARISNGVSTWNEQPDAAQADTASGSRDGHRRLSQ
jgi:hypothetical protein